MPEDVKTATVSLTLDEISYLLSAIGNAEALRDPEHLSSVVTEWSRTTYAKLADAEKTMVEEQNQALRPRRGLRM